MGGKLIIWSDMTGDNKHDSQRENAISENQDGRARVENVTSRQALWKLFARCQQSATQFDSVMIFSHGSPGLIKIGSDAIESNHLTDLGASTNLDRVCASGCSIRLQACNVAEDAIGEFYLTCWARALLSKGGGTVKGNSAKTFHNWDFTFFLGNWVTARIHSGGAVRLTDAEVLDVSSLSARVSAVRSWSKFQPADKKSETLAACRRIDNLLSRNPGDPYYYYFLADQELRQLEAFMQRKGRFGLD